MLKFKRIAVILYFLSLALPALSMASEKQAETVDRIYADPARSRMKFTPAPNAFLVEMTRRLKPGRALDVGMGQGRNAIYLVQQGWQVTGFDLAETGVRQAREQAASLGLKLDAQVRNAADFDFGTDKWDLVVLCYVNAREWLDRVRQSVRPGGVVILEYYHRDTAKMRPMPSKDRSARNSSAFGSNELLQLFSGFRILHYEDVLGVPDWKNPWPNEEDRLVRLVAQKEGAAPDGCSWRGTPYPEGGEVCYDGKLLQCGGAGWDFGGNCVLEMNR